MNDFIPIIVVFCFALFGWSIIVILDKIQKNKYLGKIIHKGKISKVIYRKKDYVNFPFDLNKIDLAFTNAMLKLPINYYKREIIKNLECVIENDIHLKGKAYVWAYGSALTHHKFRDYLTFKPIYRIYIDANVLIMKGLTNKEIGNLIRHEALHHILKIYTGDADANHLNNVWKIN